MSAPTKADQHVESKVSLQLVDPLGKSIAGLRFLIRNAEQKIVAKGATDGEGRIPAFLTALGSMLTLHVERFGTEEMKMVKTLIPWSEDFRFKIVSPKRKDTVAPQKHEGPPGPYKRKTYKVKQGDTLSQIARTHGTTAAALAVLNGIHVNDIIRVDQVLKVPNDPVGRSQAAAPKPAPAPAPQPAAPAAKPADAPVAPKDAEGGPDGTGTDAEPPAAKSKPDATPVPTKKEDGRGENGTPKTSVAPVCDQTGCIKLGDKGPLVEELNIRLMGFGNTVQAPAPFDEFTAATEKAVKQFQKDYMGVPETGRACRSVLAAIDEFGAKYPLPFHEFACQCHANSPCTHGCTGYGMARTGSGDIGYKKDGKSVAGVERPGIHRALFWSVRAVVFYLHAKEPQLGFRFMKISSGYRCWERARQMHTFTRNHLGSAADLQFKYAKNGHKVTGADLKTLRDQILAPKIHARPTWDLPNRISVEPVEKTPTWIHMDVREFHTRYLLDRYYAKTLQASEGDPLMTMAKREGRFALINCGGVAAPSSAPKPAPVQGPQQGAKPPAPKPAPQPPAKTAPSPQPQAPHPPHPPQPPRPTGKGAPRHCGEGPIAGPPCTERKPASTLTVSQLGLDFIRIWESGSLTKNHLMPYDDNKHYCTIGVGHLIDGKRSCATLASQGSAAYKKFKNGITVERENEMFAEDVQNKVDAVLPSIHVPLLQHEFDALISLAFNTGGLSKFNKLLANLNTGNYNGCCNEFADITNGGDKGLTARRKAEMKMFRNNIYDARH